MFSRGKLLVKIALENKSQTDAISSPRINLTLQGSKLVSGPVLTERDDIHPDIICYESDISDTEIIQSTNTITDEKLHMHTGNQFLGYSDTELNPVPSCSWNDDIFSRLALQKQIPNQMIYQSPRSNNKLLP